MALSQLAIAQTTTIQEKLVTLEGELADKTSKIEALQLEVKTLKDERQDLMEQLEREQEGRAADMAPLLKRIEKLEEKEKGNTRVMEESASDQ